MPMPQSDGLEPPTLGEMMRRMEEGFTRVEKRLEIIDALPDRYATRREWEKRNTDVDKALGDLRDAAKSKVANTISVISILIAGSSVLIGVVMR